MEMLLAAGNLVLLSGEEEKSGEYILMNSGGTRSGLVHRDVVSLRGWRSHWSVLLRVH